MTNLRCVDLYRLNSLGQTTICAFCFERSALAYAREEGLTQFVISINGRILHHEGVPNPYTFMRAA